ncbi:MAG: metal-dependent hydrolase [Bacteroidetes bacterium]|nr:metal-dependent hydrolase [Bacteroidota bacterium]
MASAFTQAFAAFAIGKSTLKKYSTKIAVLGMICAIFPDVDVLSFHYGIPYDSFWGHRGFIHSILFALLFSLIITSLFFRSEKTFSKNMVYTSHFLLHCHCFSWRIGCTYKWRIRGGFFSPSTIQDISSLGIRFRFLR